MCVHNFFFNGVGKGGEGVNSNTIFIKGLTFLLYTVHSNHLLSFVEIKRIICVK